MYRLTFDSSILLDGFRGEQSKDEKLKRREQAAKILRNANTDGHIEICFNAGEVPKLSPNAMEGLNISRGPWLLGIHGFSELGVSTVLGDSSKALLIAKAKEILQPKTPHDWKDYALLADHIDAGRDWFVSGDEKKHLKAKYRQEFEAIGITILSAPEAVNRLIQEGVLNSNVWDE